jgi:hypothetical protein
MTTTPSLDALLAALASKLESGALTWLELVCRDRALLTERTRLRIAFAQAARKLAAAGGEPVLLGEPPASWNALDLARSALLLAALELLPAQAHVELLEELYRTGEQREQQSILRALPVLPAPERFSALAIAACRTNSLDVFRAIAHDNPIPARHFPELHFNQLVLKAIFLAISVREIRGLAERATPELRRMVGEYASERRAASRSVPTDVDYVISLCDR